ncbi:MAG: hypothetical protein LBK22_10140 [Tannerella sp.]|jgi:hypothetical protein|nr:hypothetical protein [Tannerella sp.]
MRKCYFAFYVVAHVLFLTSLSGCNRQQEDGCVQERIIGRWQLVKCEFADAAETSSTPEAETDIEFATTGKIRYFITPTRRYIYRMDSEFLYLLNRDSDRKCSFSHVQIYKYNMEANRLQLRVFGAFLKTAGRPVCLTYEKKQPHQNE